MGKRVTVCLAVWNGEATLAKALETVYAQTYQDFDVLVLDDGSTDSSAQIASQFDCRVLTLPNAGLGAARKRMVEEATGDYIAFIDHDDFWLPEKLAVQMEIVEKTGAALVHADGWYVYEDGKEVARDLEVRNGDDPFAHILPDNRVIASTAVFDRKAMLEAGNFVADTVRCSDWYGWLILAPGRKFVHVPQKLVRYSVLSTSLANAGLRFHEAQRYLIQDKILPRRNELFAGLSSTERARYTKMLVRDVGLAYSSLGSLYQKQGNTAEARRMHRLAIIHAPDVARVWLRAVRALKPSASS